MTALIVIGAVLVAGVVVAALYDRLQRRRGVQVGVSRYEIEKREAIDPLLPRAEHGDGSQDDF